MNQCDTHRSEEENRAEKIQLCSFWISSRLFGINILDIKEICTVIDITPVYHTPDMIKGYMNIRGQIHLVMDIRKFFGFGTDTHDCNTRVILFKPTVDEPFGVLVDRMDDVVSVDVATIEDRRKKKNAPQHQGPEQRRVSCQEIIHGVCKLQKALLVILNTRSMIESVERICQMHALELSDTL